VRYGFSDFERGDALFKWSFYNEAQLLVDLYDSGKLRTTLDFINSNPHLLEVQDSSYVRFVELYNSGDIFRSVESARNFLSDVETKGIKFEKPVVSSAPAITFVVTVLIICYVKSILGWF